MTLTPSADVVTRELRGKVLLVTIDHAPVMPSDSRSTRRTSDRSGLAPHSTAWE